MQSFIIPADTWRRYVSLKAERSSLDKQITAMEDSFSLPSASELAGKVPEDSPITYPIVNGNGDEQGKLTVFWYRGATIPANWRKRIS